ncbi:hypothetical protein [Luteimonas salinilitoris]|uniref:Uncharacterized protein n=1 Tax=Luteimonas salinilitoris TaxID=3237697 RepID=A0ABV4HPD2_9GAMM
MSEEAPAMELRDGAGRPCWVSHLDRSLVARLARRPTVIPPALGDRIWRSIEYFTARARMLAQSLIDRVSPTERWVNDMPIVHVSWQQPFQSPDPDASSASPGRNGAPPPVATVIGAARRSGIEPGTSPASAKAPPQLPAVTSTADLAGMARSRNGTVPAPGQGEDHDAHGGRPTAASSVSRESAAPARRLQPADTPGDDGAVTLRMPPGRRRTAPQRTSVHSTSAVDMDRPPTSRTMTGRSSPTVREEAADAMPEVRGQRPASIAALPAEGGVLPAETKSGPVAAEAALRSGSGSGPDALPVPAEVTESPAVTRQPHRLPHAVAASGREASTHGPARLSPLDESKTVGFAAITTADAARLMEAPGRVVSPARSNEHAGDGVVASRPPPDRVRAPIRHTPAYSEGVRQPAIPPGHDGPLTDAAPRQGASFGAGATPQTVLPYAGQASLLPSGPAGSPDASRPGAEGIGGHSNDPAGLPAPDSPHAPAPSTSTGTQREDEPSRHALRALIDIDQLSRQVERRITKRLAIDAERRGGWS